MDKGPSRCWMAFARQLEPASSASFGPLVERTPQKVRHGQGPRKPTHLGVVGQLFLSNWASIMSIIWAFGGGTPRTVRRGQGPIKLKHLRVAGRLLSSNLEAWPSIMSIIWAVSAGKAAKKRDVGRGQDNYITTRCRCCRPTWASMFSIV